jgi:hypothetical protein
MLFVTFINDNEAALLAIRSYDKTPC